MRLIAAVSFMAFSLATFAAQADAGDVSVVRSQFTDKVEQSLPVAGADQLGQAARVTYWVAVRNAKEPTTITLVWKLDGHESGRQTLDIGTSVSWKTWGSHARFGAKSIEVDVLDKSGATIKTDTVTL
jgi:hypothetical protein